MPKKDSVLTTVEISNVWNKGLGLVACSPLELGTVTVQERPYATSLLPSVVPETCRTCFSSISASTKGLRTCRRCQTTHYCSYKCWSQDRRSHRESGECWISKHATALSLAVPPDVRREALLALRHLAATSPPCPATPPLSCHRHLLVAGSALDSDLAAWQAGRLAAAAAAAQGVTGILAAAAAEAAGDVVAAAEILAEASGVGSGLGLVAALLARAVDAGHAVRVSRERAEERRQQQQSGQGRPQHNVARAKERTEGPPQDSLPPSSSSSSDGSDDSHDSQHEEPAAAGATAGGCVALLGPGAAVVRAALQTWTAGRGSGNVNCCVEEVGEAVRASAMDEGASGGEGGVVTAAVALATVLSNALEVALHPAFAAGMVGVARAAGGGTAPLGLYRYGCRINHSCRPSAVAHFRPGGQLLVRLIIDLPPGGEVSLSYTDLALPRDRRRLSLYEKYGFECCCERCCCSNSPSGVSADFLLAAVRPAPSGKAAAAPSEGAAGEAMEVDVVSCSPSAPAVSVEQRLHRLVAECGGQLMRTRAPPADVFTALSHQLDVLLVPPPSSSSVPPPFVRHNGTSDNDRGVQLAGKAAETLTPAVAAPSVTSLAVTGSIRGVRVAPQHAACLDAYALLASAARRCARAARASLDSTRGPTSSRGYCEEGTVVAVGEEQGGAGTGRGGEAVTPAVVWWCRGVCASLAGAAAAERLVAAEPGMLQHATAAWSDAASTACELLSALFASAGAAEAVRASGCSAHNGTLDTDWHVSEGPLPPKGAVPGICSCGDGGDGGCGEAVRFCPRHLSPGVLRAGVVAALSQERHVVKEPYSTAANRLHAPPWQQPLPHRKQEGADVGSRGATGQPGGHHDGGGGARGAAARNGSTVAAALQRRSAVDEPHNKRQRRERRRKCERSRSPAVAGGARGEPPIRPTRRDDREWGHRGTDRYREVRPDWTGGRERLSGEAGAPRCKEHAAPRGPEAERRHHHHHHRDHREQMPSPHNSGSRNESPERRVQRNTGSSPSTSQENGHVAVRDPPSGVAGAVGAPTDGTTTCTRLPQRTYTAPPSMRGPCGRLFWVCEELAAGGGVVRGDGGTGALEAMKDWLGAEAAGSRGYREADEEEVQEDGGSGCAGGRALEAAAGAAAAALAHCLARLHLLLRLLLGEAHGACEACQFLPFFAEHVPYDVAAEVTEVASALLARVHMTYVPIVY